MREIDKLVADKVLEVPCYLSRFGNGEVLWVQFEGQDAVIFHPTENMRDAWIVVEKLVSQGIDVSIDTTLNFAYVVEFEELCVKTGVASNKQAPMAICLAALNFVGIEI